VATPNTVLFAGGKPVFSDIREDSLCIDPKDVRRKITKNTAGIVVVHIAGLVCPQMKELLEICEDRDLFLLEDAAHAHGALFDGKKAGTLGDVGAFSFYPTKVMTSGEGGMITTDDSGLAEMALMMRTHGQNAKREMVVLGHNWRMTEMAAIIGRHQLENLERFVVKRNEIARLYEKCLGDIDRVELFKVPSNIRHSYYKYPIKLSDEVDREKLAAVLKEKYGIETGNVYDPPCHLHPFYRENFGTGEGDLPVAERVLRKVLCLPMHCGISERDVEYVSEALRKSIG
jgi:dTDP-4-amino-4,6-dideoxygalactose transaminase